MYDDDGNFTPGLTPAEIERLALLIEECGEVAQAACKILRHGWDSFNPLSKDKIDNRDALAKELGQLELAVHLLKTADDVSTVDISEAFSEKLHSIKRWLHFNADLVP